jgi:hypothetical protein
MGGGQWSLFCSAHIVGGAGLSWEGEQRCHIFEEIEWTGVVEVGHPLVRGWSG